MSRPCPDEARTQAALLTGTDEAWLGTHVERCADCAVLRTTLNWMRELATVDPGDEPHLPTARQMWWKAQLVERWEAERRAAAPVDAMHGIQGLVAAVALILLAVWKWPVLREWLDASEAVQASVLVTAAIPPALLWGMAGGALLLATILILTLQVFLSD